MTDRIVGGFLAAASISFYLWWLLLIGGGGLFWFFFCLYFIIGFLEGTTPSSDNDMRSEGLDCSDYSDGSVEVDRDVFNRMNRTFDVVYHHKYRDRSGKILEIEAGWKGWTIIEHSIGQFYSNTYQKPYLNLLEAETEASFMYGSIERID